MSRSKWAKKMDRVWEAQKPGKRETAWGTVYYENRVNRSDINQLEQNEDMFLQLAEDNIVENYTPIQTNEGTFFVRNDLMSEDVTLSQKGKLKALIKKAAPIIGTVAAKAAPIILKAGGTALKNLPIPGANVAGTVLQKASAGIKKAAPLLQKLKPIAQKIQSMPTAAAAIPAAVVAAEAANVAGEAGGSAGRAAVGDTEGAARQAEMEQSQGGKFGQFVKKYKLPLIIGGGVLLAGGIYLATRKKKR